MAENSDSVLFARLEHDAASAGALADERLATIEEAFGIVQRICGVAFTGDDPDDLIISLREWEKRLAHGKRCLECEGHGVVRCGSCGGAGIEIGVRAT